MGNNGSGLLITTQGKIHRYNVDSLESLQKAVGGYIEVIVPRVAIRAGSFNPDVILIVDEEGVLKSKEVNKLATLLAGMVIVGGVVIAKVSGEDIVNFTNRELIQVENQCKRLLGLLTGAEA